MNRLQGGLLKSTLKSSRSGENMRVINPTYGYNVTIIANDYSIRPKYSINMRRKLFKAQDNAQQRSEWTQILEGAKPIKWYRRPYIKLRMIYWKIKLRNRK